MLIPVKQFSVSFVSDGVATALVVDASVAPLSQDFRGAAPAGVLLPVVSSAAGVIAGVTAVLVGTTVTFTFPQPPPMNDVNGNLIIYTATFYLELP